MGHWELLILETLGHWALIDLKMPCLVWNPEIQQTREQTNYGHYNR